MSFRVGFEQAEQHYLDAAGAGGLELLLGSGLQGCVADFDGHGWLLGFKGTGKCGVNQQNRRRDGTVESHASRREAWTSAGWYSTRSV